MTGNCTCNSYALIPLLLCAAPVLCLGQVRPHEVHVHDPAITTLAVARVQVSDVRGSRPIEDEAILRSAGLPAVKVAAPQTDRASGNPGDPRQPAAVTVTKKLPNSPFALPSLRELVPLGYDALARTHSQVPCQAISVGSEDPWVNSPRVVGWIKAAPEFVNSGIAISPDANHADLALQFEQSMDSDGKVLHLLTVASSSAKIWDQTTVDWRPSEEEADAGYEQDADYEEVIARKTLRMVLAHCILPPRGSEPETHDLSETANQELLASEAAKERILKSRILKPVVQTSFMRDKILFSALKFRPEFREWGMKIGINDDRSDVDLVVGHELSTLTWTYKLLDHASGELFDQGTVVAFTDTHAASRIVALTVNRIAGWRLPAREPPASTTQLKVPPVFAFPGPQTWKVEVDSNDENRKYPSNMRLSVKQGNLVFSDQVGTAVFSIPGEQILDFVDATDFSSLSDSFHSHLDDGRAVVDSCAEAGEAAGFCVALGLGGLLAYVTVETPLYALRGPQHAFDIAWSENNRVRVDSFRVSKGNYRILRWILDTLSRDEVRDSR